MNRNNYFYRASSEDFKKIPGKLIVYWNSETIVDSFKEETIDNYFDLKKGITTGDNDKLILGWYEIAFDLIGISLTNSDDNYLYYPHCKGGDSVNGTEIMN